MGQLQKFDTIMIRYRYLQLSKYSFACSTPPSVILYVYSHLVLQHVIFISCLNIIKTCEFKAYVLTCFFCEEAFSFVASITHLPGWHGYCIFYHCSTTTTYFKSVSVFFLTITIRHVLKKS